MSDDTRTVHERMAAALADLSYIPKGTSKGVSYEFRGIDAVFNHLHQVLAKHGLFQSPRVLDDWQVNLIAGTPDHKGNPRQQSQALFRVCVDVYGPAGDCVTLGPGLAQSHDYGDKAVYQAQQNAIKYVLLEAFCIPTQEQDMDAREADAIPAANGQPAPSLKDELAALDQVIAEAKAAGIEGDYNATREWASESAENARTAAGRLRKAIAEKEAA